MELPDTSSQNVPSAAAARRARAIASGLVVDIGGVPVLLRANGLEHASVLESLLGATPTTAVRPLATIDLGHATPSRPEHPADEVYGSVEIWRLDDDQLAVAHGGTLIARVSSDRIAIGGTHADLAIGVRQVLHPALTNLLAGFGAFVLHAGALLVDDRAVLVFGPTGAGKSTLIAVALMEAMPVLSDDLVVVRPSTDGLEVCGIPRPIAVPDDIDMTFPSTPMHDARRRNLIAADHLRPGWFTIAGGVHVDHGSSGQGTLTPRQSVGVIDQVVGAFFAATQPRLLRDFYPHAATIARLPSWTLAHALPPSERRTGASQLLREISSAVRDAGRSP